MNRRTALTLGLAALARAAEKQPTAEEILDKYIDVTGGRAAYEKVKTEVASATMEFVGKAVKGRITLYKAVPSKNYALVEIDGVGKVEAGSDGEVVWERSQLQGPRLKTGEEREASLRENDLHSRVFWKNRYKSATFGGAATVEGRDCYKVVMTPNLGKPETRYYDRKLGLLVKVEETARTQMGEIPAETFIEDYRDEGGILTAHRMRQRAIGQEFVTTIHKMQYNADIPDSRFDLPDDVKALAARSATPAKK